MIDLKKLREDPEGFRKSLGKKRFEPEALDRILAKDARARELTAQVETMRAQKNAASKRIPKVPPEERQSLVADMKALGEKLSSLEDDLRACKDDLEAELILIPNPPHESVPEGAGEQDNTVVSTHGTVPVFDFEPRDHLALGEQHHLIEIPRAARACGSRFAYLMGELVHLEFALVRYALDKLTSSGFRPCVTPIMVREQAMFGTGFFPADANEIYKIQDEDHYLVGTSEVPLAALHIDEILAEEDLPIRYAGFSTCLRREAGAYGKDTRGIFRVHQFDKVEMFTFSHPDRSWEEHQRLLSIEEEIARELGFAYQVVNVCAGDLGAPAAKKYDIEVWLPGQQAYRELTSCSNCTDFQARRLKCRYKSGKSTRFVHTLNGTAIAIGRTLIALLETHQQADGSVELPEALHRYLPAGLTRIG